MDEENFFENSTFIFFVEQNCSNSTENATAEWIPNPVVTDYIRITVEIQKSSRLLNNFQTPFGQSFKGIFDFSILA